MDYLNVALKNSTIAVPPSDRLNLPGEWQSIIFDTDIADGAGHHSGSSPLIGSGAARIINGKLLLKLDGFQPGVEIQVRQYEVNSSGDRVETHDPDEFYTAATPPDTDEQGNYLYPPRTHKHLHVWSYVNSGHRLGIELSQWPHDLSAPVGTIAFAQFVGTLDTL